MNIPDVRKSILYAALLGILTAAISGSTLRGHRPAFADRSVAATTRDVSGMQAGARGVYDSDRRRMQTKYEARIRDHDMRMSRFKEQRAKGSARFRKTFDARVAELERRNAALNAKLDDLTDDNLKALAAHK